MTHGIRNRFSRRTSTALITVLAAMAALIVITMSASADHGSATLIFTDASDTPSGYVVLPGIGDAVQVRVGVHDIGAGLADTVQLKIVHDPAVVSISNPSCVGIYAGGFGTGAPVDLDGEASGLLCAISNGPLGDSGAIVEFTLTRTGAGDIELWFSPDQPLRTTFFENGETVAVGVSARLKVLSEYPPTLVFSPSMVTLDNITDSVVVTLEATGIGVAAADTLQVNVIHDDLVIQVSDPQCVGIYAGGSVIPAARVDGDTATAFGCSLENGPLAAGGPVMTFTVTRMAMGEPVLNAGTDGPFRTAFILAGDVMTTGMPTGLQILENHAPVTNGQAVSTDEDVELALSLSVSDDNGDLLTFQFNLAGLSGALSGVAPDLTYTPAQDFNGIDSFTFSVSDDEGAASGTSTVTITVVSVNDAPSFVTGGDESVLENSGAHSTSAWADGLDAGAANESGQTLTFTVSNNNNPLFAIQPALSAAGDLTYELTPGVNGAAAVTLQLTDNGGTENGGIDASPVSTFTITVIAVFNVTGELSFQGAFTVSATVAIGANVTLTPEGGEPVYATAAVSGDGTFAFVNVPLGAYRIAVAANGFLSVERASLSVASDVIMPAIQLRGGLVNNSDSIVDGADVSLVMVSFGITTADRTDGAPGNWVDINGDGAVSALDISITMSNLGMFGPQAW